MSGRTRTPESGPADERRPEPPPKSSSGSNLPAASPGDAGPHGLGSPLEGLGTALQLQAEILKRLHDQQQKMGEALADSRRSELMIQSTQALNESFTGMKRVQERLLDRLAGQKTGARLLPWSAGIGLLAIAAAVWWGIDTLGRRVDATGEAVKSSTEGLAAASLDALEARLLTLEGRDTKLVKEELERLRSLVLTIGEEKVRLSEERDRAREDLGAARDRGERLDAEVLALRTRAETAEKEQARLTGRALADQQLVDQLNKTLDNLRTAAAKTPPAVTAQAPAPAILSGPASETPLAAGAPSRDPLGESAAAASGPPKPAWEWDRDTMLPTDAEGRLRLSPGPIDIPPGGVPEAKGGAATTTDAPGAATGAGASGRVPVPAEFLESLNALLARHRGSDVYTFLSAREMDSTGLHGVVLEVRGSDGTLAKTVEAENAAFTLTTRSTMVEVTFETGFVHFQQVLTRPVKSPFFNNRYQVILIGVDPQPWIQAALPFLVAK